MVSFANVLHSPEDWNNNTAGLETIAVQLPLL